MNRKVDKKINVLLTWCQIERERVTGGTKPDFHRSATKKFEFSLLFLSFSLFLSYYVYSLPFSHSSLFSNVCSFFSFVFCFTRSAIREKKNEMTRWTYVGPQSLCWGWSSSCDWEPVQQDCGWVVARRGQRLRTTILLAGHSQQPTNTMIPYRYYWHYLNSNQSIVVPNSLRKNGWASKDTSCGHSWFVLFSLDHDNERKRCFCSTFKSYFFDENAGQGAVAAAAADGTTLSVSLFSAFNFLTYCDVLLHRQRESCDRVHSGIEGAIRWSL